MAFADERAVADEGLARLSSAPSVVWPPVARRIRDARLRLGITDAEVAHRWGVERSLYWDLELDDDELFTNIAFGSLAGFAAALELPLMVLLFGEEPEAQPPEVGYAEVAAGLQRRLADEGLTVDTLSDAVGWELGGVLEDPERLAAFNIPGVYDVCHAAGVDWVGLLAHESRGHRTRG